MSRSRGTYSTLENWVLDLAPTLPGAAGWVLLKLAAQVNYKRKTMTIGQLIDALPYKERTLQQACACLVQEGYVLCAGSEYVLRGACADLAQALRKNAHPEQPKKYDSDVETSSGNFGITPHNKKESEGIEKKELKDKNTPLTPQGGSQAGESESSAPDQAQTQGSEAQQTNAADTEHVPRRRAAAPPSLPDDLAALPGVPEAWQQWLKYAREVRLKITESVADAQFIKLRRLHADGWDLPHIVQHAIETNWKSFYEIRGEKPRRNLQLDPPEPEKPRRSYQ